MDQPSTFLKALQQVLKTDVAAIALTVEELFFMANQECPREERIRYGTYLRFIDSLDKYGEPTVPHAQADLLLEVHDCIKAEQAKQRLALLQNIMQGQKDWRRFVWLLQWQEKQERQKQVQAQQMAKEQRDRQKAAEAAAKLSSETETMPTNNNPAPTPSTLSDPATIQQSYKASYYDRQQIGKTG